MLLFFHISVNHNILNIISTQYIDKKKSWLIGDKESDIEAANSFGITNTILVKSGHKIDEEYNKEIIHREIRVKGPELEFYYKTERKNAKLLRTAISAFITNLKLVL